MSSRAFRPFRSYRALFANVNIFEALKFYLGAKEELRL